MKRVIFASVAALALAGSALASTPLTFAKSGASEQEFRHDQVVCERASTHADFRRQLEMPASAPASKIAVTYSKADFLSCMNERGYRLDANGFQAGRVWTFSKQRGQPQEVH